jgi:hypothetical protein
VRATSDNYGSAVSIDGNYAVVGTSLEDEDANELNSLASSGSAYVLYNNGSSWIQVTKLTASTREAEDRFGYSVSISGDYIVIGAHFEDHDAAESNSVSDAGSVYIFYRNQGGTDKWGLVKKIVAPSRAVDDHFGFSVAISGDNVLVGAPDEDEDASEANRVASAGSVYIYNRNQGGTNNWGQVKKINASVRTNFDYFGYAVSVSNEYAIVGAYQEDENESDFIAVSNAGSAYIYYQNQGGSGNWGRVKKITASSRSVSDQFGFSVSISGNNVVVGAIFEDHDVTESNSVSNAGAAYIYSRDQGGSNNWGQVKKIIASIRTVNDEFGRSVAISGNHVIVGAHQDDESATDSFTLTNSGSAYIYKQDQSGTNNWGQYKKITAGVRGGSDFFGYAVGMSGSTILVGSYSEDEDESELNAVTNAGASYFYHENQGGTGNWGQFQKTVILGRTTLDGFSTALAIDGDYAVIGAYNDDEDASGSAPMLGAGSAYIFKQINGVWTQIKKITATVRAAGDNFGYSVSIFGNYIVVGANLEDEDATESNNLNGAGSAYIFKKDEGGTDNWGFIKKITASTRGGNDNFGIAVSIYGNYIIAGAYVEDEDVNESNTKSGSGSAYIFSKNEGGTDNWGQVKKICATTRAVDDNFGWSVAIYGNYAIVGALMEDHNTAEADSLSMSGSAYIFKKDEGGTNNWGQIKKITASTRAVADQFGCSVAIGDSIIVVGASLEDHDAAETNLLSDAGSAYIFKMNQGGNDNWGQVKKITNSIRGSADYFGWKLALSGDNLVVGAYGEDHDASDANSVSAAGSAYIFNKDQGGSNNWGQVKKIIASTRNVDDYFGWAVGISGNYVIISSHADDEDATESNTLTNSGSAYLYFNGCHSSATLPTTANNTYVGSYKSTDEYGWTHYCTVDNKLLLSLNIGSSGAVVSADSVKLKLGSSNTFSSNSIGGMITNTGGYAMIDRRWNVSPTTQPSTDSVGVRFYFRDAEYTAVQTALANLTNPSTLSSVSQLSMYKATSGAAFANPHTVSGIVLTNGTTPSTNVWVEGTQGATDHYAEFKVTSFSGGGGGGGGGGGAGPAPLPVTLLNFTANAVDNQYIHLSWATATEINNMGFEILRSTDGKNFETIGWLEGNLNSNHLQSYGFDDKNVATGIKYYYLLKQIDVNNQSNLSEVRLASLNDLKTKPVSMVVSNPFTDNIYITINSEKMSNAYLSIIDMNGLILDHSFLNITKGNHSFIYTPKAYLAAGVYLLKLKDALGNETIIKVVKE